MSAPRVPVIDLARPQDEVVHAIADACTKVGFLTIVGHGVDPAVEDAAWTSARAFFDLPLDEKLAVAMPEAGYPYGYTPISGETLAASLGEVAPPDLKQSLAIGPVDPAPRKPRDDGEAWARLPNRWPIRPAGLRAAWEDYYRSMSALATRLMQLFALGLDLPDDHFLPLIDAHVSAMRFLDYPAPDAPALPGQLRAGAHTDYGTLTILRQEQRPGGLEVLGPDGAWMPVPAVPGGYVVNLGDTMARWTNDRWRSTLHRVVNPSADAHGDTRRQSVAFFHNANWDAMIKCLPTCVGPGESPKYSPVAAGPHLMDKYRRTVAHDGPAA